MKTLFTIIFALLSFVALSQEYPKIETDEKGQKIVIFTLEQAQKIDNDLEILDLLDRNKIQCDSLNIARLRIIDSQNSKIVLLEKSISELKAQSSDKDLLLANKDEQIKNLEESVKIQEEQKCIKQKQIEGLQGDLKKEKKKKWLFGAGGLAIGILIALL
jgi:hypothetical protein